MLDIATHIKTILVASAIAAAGLAGWTMNGWRLNAQIDRMVSEHSLALANANKDALDRYTAMERKKQEAVNEANQIAKRNAAAASAAAGERDRLRQQIAATDNRVSTATIASLRNYTTTINTVFAECVAELEGMAKAADGHALDSRTIIKAWPQ